nr:hypothetical protein [Streptococcus suis]
MTITCEKSISITFLKQKTKNIYYTRGASSFQNSVSYELE